MGEEGSGESGQEVWAQWNVIMADDVMLRVISYGFSASDAFDHQLLFCAKQGTHDVDNRGRAGALA